VIRDKRQVTSGDSSQRQPLPIPRCKPVGLTTYDPKTGGRLIRHARYPPVCRKPLDAVPVSADSRTHRATSGAPDVISPSADQPETYRGRTSPGFARRPAIHPVGKAERALNELTDWTACSVDAVTGAKIGPHRKSRLI